MADMKSPAFDQYEVEDGLRHITNAHRTMQNKPLMKKIAAHAKKQAADTKQAIGGAMSAFGPTAK
jgi:hypothetical protein